MNARPRDRSQCSVGCTAGLRCWHLVRPQRRALPRSKPRNLLTLYPALLDLRTSSAKKARTRGAGQSRRATLETGLVALTRCLMMIENSKPQHCAMLCMQPPAVCRRPAPLLFSRVRVQAGAHCDQLISQSVKQQRRQRRQQQTAPSLAL